MMRSTARARTAALGGGVLALTLLLGACGDDSSTAGGHDMGSTGSSSPPMSASDKPIASPTGTPASGPHNKADVAFATEMIPHHGQAVLMAGLASARASSAEVKGLAAAIRGAQAPEIAQMSAWLAGWGEDVPDPTAMCHGMGDDIGGGMGHDTACRMTGDQMSRLAAASGATFDALWLRSMTAHHEGAVATAKAELADGTNPDATRLARRIIAAQQSG
jgi:uncharacterized protein (DUF305 family)